MSIRSDRFLWGRRDIAYHVAHTVTSEILLGGRSRGEKSVLKKNSMRTNREHRHAHPSSR